MSQSGTSHLDRLRLQRTQVSQAVGLVLVCAYVFSWKAGDYRSIIFSPSIQTRSYPGRNLGCSTVVVMGQWNLKHIDTIVIKGTSRSAYR